MNNRTLSVLNDFSEFPGLRHCSISDNSGEEFYHKVLNSAFKAAYEKGEKLIIDLDKTDGYAPSFLDEAFGNLVYDFTLKIVKDKVEIISQQEPHWKAMIEDETYPQWEKRRKDNDPPKITAPHVPWYRLINNSLKLDIWAVPSTSA